MNPIATTNFRKMCGDGWRIMDAGLKAYCIRSWCDNNGEQWQCGILSDEGDGAFCFKSIQVESASDIAELFWNARDGWQ